MHSDKHLVLSIKHGRGGGGECLLRGDIMCGFIYFMFLYFKEKNNMNISHKMLKTGYTQLCDCNLH